MEGSVEVLPRLGVPDRLVRILLAIRAWRASRIWRGRGAEE